MNKNIRTLVIAPITSNSKNYPTRVEIKENTTKGWVMIDQIRTIDKQRILKISGKISENESKKIKEVIVE